MENQINFPGSLETKNYLSKTLFFTFPSNKFYQIFTKFGKRSLLSDKCHHPWMHWTTAARIRLGRHQPKAMLQNDIWFHMWKGVIHSATAFSCNWVSKNVLFIAFHTSKGKKKKLFHIYIPLSKEKKCSNHGYCVKGAKVCVRVLDEIANMRMFIFVVT